MILQSLTYVVHFWLLGQPAAAASAGVATLRTLAATRTSSRAVCALFVVLGLVAGGAVLQSWIGVLPVVASAAGTLSIFLLREIRLRLGMLFCTLLWLVHNVVTGSVGGTLLELVIAATNLFTLYRLARERRGAG